MKHWIEMRINLVIIVGALLKTYKFIYNANVLGLMDNSLAELLK
jgi:hypothetical protein